MGPSQQGAPHSNQTGPRLPEALREARTPRGVGCCPLAPLVSERLAPASDLSPGEGPCHSSP